MSKVGNSFQWIGMRLIVAIILAAIVICGVLIYKYIYTEKFTLVRNNNGDIIILKEEIKRFIDIALMVNPPLDTDIRSFFSVGLVSRPGFKDEIKGFIRSYTLSSLRDFLKSIERTFLEGLCKNVSPMNRNQDADYNKMVRDLIRKQIDSLIMFYNEVLTALDSKSIELDYNRNDFANQIKCILKSANFMSQASRNDSYYSDLANKFYELIFKVLNKKDYDYCDGVNMNPPYNLSSTYINTKNKVKECKVEPDNEDTQTEDMPPQDEDALYMPYDNKSPTVWTTRGSGSNQRGTTDTTRPDTPFAFGSLLGSNYGRSNSTSDSTPTSTPESASWRDNYNTLFGNSSGSRGSSGGDEDDDRRDGRNRRDVRDGSDRSDRRDGRDGRDGSDRSDRSDRRDGRDGRDRRGRSDRSDRSDRRVFVSGLVTTPTPTGSNDHTYPDSMDGNIYLKDAEGPNNFFFPTILIEN